MSDIDATRLIPQYSAFYTSDGVKFARVSVVISKAYDRVHTGILLNKLSDLHHIPPNPRVDSQLPIPNICYCLIPRFFGFLLHRRVWSPARAAPQRASVPTAYRRHLYFSTRQTLYG